MGEERWSPEPARQVGSGKRDQRRQGQRHREQQLERQPVDARQARAAAARLLRGPTGQDGEERQDETAGYRAGGVEHFVGVGVIADRGAALELQDLYVDAEEDVV